MQTGTTNHVFINVLLTKGLKNVHSLSLLLNCDFQHFVQKLTISKNVFSPSRGFIGKEGDCTVRHRCSMLSELLD